MDERQTALIRASWDLIQERGEDLARAFYDRLFEIDPAIEDLFVLAEMESQEAKFVAMLHEVVLLAGSDPERFEGERSGIAKFRDSLKFSIFAPAGREAPGQAAE